MSSGPKGPATSGKDRVHNLLHHLGQTGSEYTGQKVRLNPRFVNFRGDFHKSTKRPLPREADGVVVGWQSKEESNYCTEVAKNPYSRGLTNYELEIQEVMNSRIPHSGLGAVTKVDAAAISDEGRRRGGWVAIQGGVQLLHGGPPPTPTLEAAQGQILSQSPTDATRFWWHFFGS